MGIESIAVLDYTELCSLAFLPTIDDIIGGDLKLVNVGSKKFKELFYYYIEEEISHYKKQGLNIVLINSCKLMNNWRYTEIEQLYTNSVVDSRLKITDRQIYDVINSIWMLLSKNSPYNTIRNKELCSKETKKIVIQSIGISHIITTDEKYEYITDNNNLFQGSSSIPRYLEEEVIQVLRNRKLMI